MGQPDAPAAHDASASPDSAEHDGALADASPAPASRCNGHPPAGAPLAASPVAYSGGTCPRLRAGYNELTSQGWRRNFLLVLPTDPRPEERFPVVFAWHWLNGQAEDFLLDGLLQQAADTLRFIAVIPSSKGDLELPIPLIEVGLPWPIVRFVSNGRMDEEFSFFDDMLACLAEQLPVNRECVSSMGISAGALFTAQLASARSEHLASFVSLSGGVRSGDSLSNFLLRDWDRAARTLPAMVLWGGGDDVCIGLEFDESSVELEDELDDDGHFYLECVHNCGHGVWFDLDAPGDAAAQALDSILGFIFDHPYWVPEGTSSYLTGGLPPTTPPWCGIGADSAAQRSGPCPPAKCTR